MNGNLEISVIVPVYNVEKYLKKCLDSILNQDFENFEIVLINDGSTDSSQSIIDEYVNKYPEKIRAVMQENKGLGGARNSGILISKGAYLLFVDSDDTIKPDTLSGIYNNIISRDADIGMFGMEYIDENGKVLNERTEFNEDLLEFSLDDQLLVFAKDSYICDKVYKKSLFTDYNISFPERAWYEDLRTVPKLFLHAGKIVFVKKIYYSYLQRDGSIMHNVNVEKNNDMLDTINDVINYYKNENMFDKYREMLMFLSAYHATTLCILRVCGTSPRHHLIKELRKITEQNFPDYRKHREIAQQMPTKYRFVYELSCRHLYFIIYLVSKLKSLLK